MYGYGLAGTLDDTQALRLGLEAQQAELAALLPRVVATADAVPGVDASGWAGPASLAYQNAMTGLQRECAGAVELVRWASELNVAALYELQARA